MPPSKDQPWWSYVLDRFGFPTLAAIALGWAVWQATSWFAPKVDMLIDTHITTVRKMSDTLDSQHETLRAIVSDKVDRDRKIDEIHQAVVPAQKTTAAPPPSIGPSPE